MFLISTEAFGALWMLSFDKENQDVILQDDSVMGSLLKNRTSQCKKIKNSCNGALWNMREKLSSIAKYKELGKPFFILVHLCLSNQADF